MKKNILIVILSATTCLSLVFAYQQKVKSEDYRMQIIEARIRTEEALKSAQEETQIARAEVAMAYEALAKKN